MVEFCQASSEFFPVRRSSHSVLLPWKISVMKSLSLSHHLHPVMVMVMVIDLVSLLMSDLLIHLPLYPQIPLLPKLSEILDGITNEKQERCVHKDWFYPFVAVY